MIPICFPDRSISSIRKAVRRISEKNCSQKISLTPESLIKRKTRCPANRPSSRSSTSRIVSALCISSFIRSFTFLFLTVTIPCRAVFSFSIFRLPGIQVDRSSTSPHTGPENILLPPTTDTWKKIRPPDTTEK